VLGTEGSVRELEEAGSGLELILGMEGSLALDTLLEFGFWLGAVLLGVSLGVELGLSLGTELSPGSTLGSEGALGSVVGSLEAGSVTVVVFSKVLAVWLRAKAVEAVIVAVKQAATNMAKSLSNLFM
jgi:hypothetical protein